MIFLDGLLGFLKLGGERLDLSGDFDVRGVGILDFGRHDVVSFLISGCG